MQLPPKVCVFFQVGHHWRQKEITCYNSAPLVSWSGKELPLKNNDRTVLRYRSIREKKYVFVDIVFGIVQNENTDELIKCWSYTKVLRSVTSEMLHFKITVLSAVSGYWQEEREQGMDNLCIHQWQSATILGNFWLKRNKNIWGKKAKEPHMQTGSQPSSMHDKNTHF